MFRRALVTLGLSFGVLLMPLAFHQSPEPVLGPYGALYVALIATLAAFALAITLAVARACQRRDNLVPLAAATGVIAIVLLVAALSEIALGFSLRDRDTFAEYQRWGHRKSLIFGFEPRPNRNWTGAGARYSTDAYGFRTRVAARSSSPTPSDLRIFTMGGSSTFGYGLDDDATWSHYLERNLRRAPGGSFADAVVVNAGANGFNSLQIALRYYLRVARHAPTHVVLYAGHNDVQTFAMPDDGIWLTERILHAPTLAAYWAARSRGMNPYARSLLAFTVASRWGSVDRKRLRSPYRSGRDRKFPSPVEVEVPEDRDVEGVIEYNAARFARNVETWCTLLLADGVEPVLTTFIHALPPDKPRARAIERHNELLREIANRRSLRLVDIAAAFASRVAEEAEPPGKFFQKDRYHPARAGAEFIAEQLSAGLRTPSAGSADAVGAGPTN